MSTSPTTAATSSSSGSQSATFEAILKYDWENDQDFNAGLVPIISNATTKEQAEELTLRAKCYYFSRQSGIPISFENFQQFLSGQGPTPPISISSPSTPTPSATTTQPNSPLPPPPPPPPTPLTPTPILTPSLTPIPTPTHLPTSLSSLTDPTTTTTTITTNIPGDDNTKAPYPLSFAHIVELITTGQPIPGIREIPNKLSEEAPSLSVQSRRRKPWESAGAEEDSEGHRENEGRGGDNPMVTTTAAVAVPVVAVAGDGGAGNLN